MNLFLHASYKDCNSQQLFEWLEGACTTNPLEIKHLGFDALCDRLMLVSISTEDDVYNDRN
jgi:hypothetical protein